MTPEEQLGLIKLHLIPPDSPYGRRRSEAPIGWEREPQLFSDLKELIDVYGAGWINNYLNLYSPFADDPACNLFHKTEEFFEIVSSLLEYEARASLLRDTLMDGVSVVWGGTINGETLIVTGGELSTSERVIIASSDMDVVVYWLSASEFLFKLVCGAIKGEFFSLDFQRPFIFRKGPAWQQD